MSNYIIDEIGFKKITKKLKDALVNNYTHELNDIAKRKITSEQLSNSLDNESIKKKIEQFNIMRSNIESYHNFDYYIKEECEKVIHNKIANYSYDNKIKSYLFNFFIMIDIIKEITEENIEEIRSELQKIYQKWENYMEKKDIEQIKEFYHLYLQNQQKINVLLIKAETIQKAFYQEVNTEKEVNEIFQLTKLQNILAQSMGFRNYNSLRHYFDNTEDNEAIAKNLEQFLNHSSPNEIIDLMSLFLNKKEMWEARSSILLNALIHALCDLRDREEIVLNLKTIKEYLIFENIAKLSKRKDIQSHLSEDLKKYIRSLPGYVSRTDSGMPNIHYSETMIEQHGYFSSHVAHLVSLLEPLEETTFICPFVGETTENFLGFANKNSSLWFTSSQKEKNYIGFHIYNQLVQKFGKRSYSLFDLIMLGLNSWGNEKDNVVDLFISFIERINFVKNNSKKLF